MVRRPALPALPAPAPRPRARAGEAEGTGLCAGLAGVAPASPNPWGWVTETVRPDPEMRKGPVSPLLAAALLSQTPAALPPSC